MNPMYKMMFKTRFFLKLRRKDILYTSTTVVCMTGLIIKIIKMGINIYMSTWTLLIEKLFKH